MSEVPRSPSKGSWHPIFVSAGFGTLSVQRGQSQSNHQQLKIRAVLNVHKFRNKHPFLKISTRSLVCSINSCSGSRRDVEHLAPRCSLDAPGVFVGMTVGLQTVGSICRGSHRVSPNFSDLWCALWLFLQHCFPLQRCCFRALSFEQALGPLHTAWSFLVPFFHLNLRNWFVIQSNHY